MAAAVVIFRRRKEMAKKKEEAELRMHKRLFVNDILQSWDIDHNGCLSSVELKDWLSSIALGPVTDDELRWVLATATQNRETDLQKAKVRPSEFASVAEAWVNYKKSKKEIDLIFERYDPLSRGQLGKTFLRTLLKETDGGREPSEEEVEWVLQNADVTGSGSICKPELTKAIALWYYHLRLKNEMEEMPQVEVVETAFHRGCGSGSLSCVVM